jgi:putative tryptophan/tyrosine transport system substrate-binding protein
MIRRREFITLLGGAAASWPLMARAQQQAMPVIGILNASSHDEFSDRLRAFRQGLKETGYLEGENLAIEHRWADNQLDRLPELASQLVRRQVAVIAATSIRAAVAAKAATTTIPVVFMVGDDPVRLGLVASLSRPGGNLTGTNFFSVELGAKRLELLRELVPAAARIAVLVNPANPANAESTIQDVGTAVRAMGSQIQVLHASSSRDIDAAFASLARERSDALYVSTGPPFTDRRVQLALLAARSGLSAIYGARSFAEAGGLMSYGASLTEAYRQAAVYVGRILKGAKPVDLPVAQSTKFELVINAQTARMLGLNVPASLLARADEVIE